MYIRAENITIDAGGKLSGDKLGYLPEHGPPRHANGTFNIGLHGIINPGKIFVKYPTL